MYIQSESYLASNIHIVVTALEKIKIQQKAPTSSFSELNTLVWEQRANFYAINYFKLCIFCSEGVLLSFCALDGLHYLSLVMRKPDFCICENKDADQLRGNREADQHLCFR